MSLASIIKDIMTRLEGVEAIKDIIFDEVEETIREFKDSFDSIGDKIKAEIQEELTELKLELFGEFEDVKQELLSHVGDLKAIKDDLMIDLGELKEEVEVDVQVEVEKLRPSIKEVIEQIQKENPTLFRNRIELTKHMNTFIADEGYGKDWYVAYRSLKNQLVK